MINIARPSGIDSTAIARAADQPGFAFSRFSFIFSAARKAGDAMV
jgi:hypothetical protein